MPTIQRNHYVLAVHNIRESARFYVDVLGFQIVNEPPGWIFVRRDNCMIMLGECPDDIHPSKLGCHNWYAYLLVDNADAYHAEIKSRNPDCVEPISTKPWNMRDFCVHTTDGHRIMIGHMIQT